MRSLRLASSGRLWYLSALSLGLLIAAPRTARSDEPWTRVSEKGGIVLEKRSVTGSSFLEYRATTRSAIAADRIAQAVWVDRNGRFSARYRRKFEVLWEKADDRAVYEWLRTPIVSDRDYAVRIHRWSDG